jgi:hypothetical protein
MSASSEMPRPVALAALVIVLAMAGCAVTYQLPPAVVANTQGTTTLYALTGTSLSLPSAYDIQIQNVAFTDRTSSFDFAFDIRVDSLNDTAAVLLPRGALGLYMDGGLQVSAQAFDAITLAPTGGYQDSLPVPVKLGTVVLAASRSETCNFGYTYPLYGKFEVTALDLVARSVTFKLLIDSSCGYRSLASDTLPPTQ